MLLSHQQNVGKKSGHKNNRHVTVQIFEEDSNKSKFGSRGNEEKFEFWYCLLPFGTEPAVFSIPVNKLKIRKIQDYNFCLWFCMGVKLGL
jgi:hypothetical protein